MTERLTRTYPEQQRQIIQDKIDMAGFVWENLGIEGWIEEFNPKAKKLVITQPDAITYPNVLTHAEALIRVGKIRGRLRDHALPRFRAELEDLEEGIRRTDLNEADVQLLETARNPQTDSVSLQTAGIRVQQAEQPFLPAGQPEIASPPSRLVQRHFLKNRNAVATG